MKRYKFIWILQNKKAQQYSFDMSKYESVSVRETVMHGLHLVRVETGINVNHTFGGCLLHQYVGSKIGAYIVKKFKIPNLLTLALVHSI